MFGRVYGSTRSALSLLDTAQKTDLIVLIVKENPPQLVLLLCTHLVERFHRRRAWCLRRGGV